MRLSARGQYGVRAVVELAGNYRHGPLPLRGLVLAQEVSPSYLEHILRTLRQAGLVASTRGAHGGYCLARPPQQITVGQVVRALDGPIAPVACASESGPAPCDRAVQCPTRKAWLRLRDGIAAALDGTTIAELLDGRSA
jgi:Rrf2 family cysteine metabolism transcriptional repressor